MFCRCYLADTDPNARLSTVDLLLLWLPPRLPANSFLELWKYALFLSYFSGYYSERLMKRSLSKM